MQIFIQGKDQRKAMDMREQLYMLEIEKHRGIKDAAQALHISPPALSIFLGNLEERTGTKFFRPDRETVCPNRGRKDLFRTCKRNDKNRSPL